MGHDRLTVISIHNTTTHWNPILEHKPSLAPHSDYFVSHRVADLRLAHTAVALEQIAHTARITHVSCLYWWLWSRLNWHRLWHCFDAGSARCQALRTGLLLASNRVAALLLSLKSLAVSLQTPPPPLPLTRHSPYLPQVPRHAIQSRSIHIGGPSRSSCGGIHSPAGVRACGPRPTLAPR